MKKVVLATLALICAIAPARAQRSVTDETLAIARDAYIYGFPLIDNYRIQYSYFVDRNSTDYKAVGTRFITFREFIHLKTGRFSRPIPIRRILGLEQTYAPSPW